MGGKIKKIAFLLFSVIFVAFFAVVFADILGLGQSAHKQMTGTMTNVSATNLNKYAGTEVTGSEVKSAIANIKTLGGDLKLYVSVTTSAGNTTTYGPAGSKLTYSQSDTSAADYINPSAVFESSVIPNSNGVTEYIKFVQK